MPIALASLIQQPAATDERIRSSPIAWVIAGGLLLVALYLLIRLLEWDLMNEEAANQEDPLLK